jgi:exonuclease SbcC
MRILRIKFENLNSLPSGDIDLEHGPLASAGIFAITGPTGAGKSTLLDAITLALYGRAARYETEPNPENMMSRHTGSCLAEVVFEVPGGRYQARWERRRARGKAEGKIQPAKRTVTEDGSGTVLAAKIDEADQLIEQLTGLDYERFRRSVLLAQGEFTRFLKAKPSERAGLLESLTGTVIYSRLGELAYREATRREEELNSRREALGRVVLLTEEERAARTAEIERLGLEFEALKQERQTASGRIEEGRQLLARISEESAILARQTALLQETAQAAPRLERLQTHQSAQPFLGLLQILDAMEAQVAIESSRYDEARASVAQSRVRLASGLKAAGAVTSKLIEAARREIEAAQSQKTGVEKAWKETGLWLEAHAQDAKLDAAFAELADRINQLAESRRQAAALQKERARLTAQREESCRRFAALQEEQRQAEAGRKAADSEVQIAAAAVAKLLQGRSREAIDEEFSKLGPKRDALVRLRTALEKRDAAAAEAAKLADEEAHFVEEIETARQEKIAAGQEAETQRALLESARVEVELQERMAGMADQRARLEEGQPCPLCGALEHPYAQPHFSASIEEAHRNLKAAKTASESADKEAILAAQALTRAEERLVGLQRRRGELRQQQTAGHEAFEQLARSVRLFTPEAIDEVFSELEKAIAAHQEWLQAYRQAGERLHAAEKALLAQEKRLATVDEKRAAEQKTIADLESRIAAVAAQLECPGSDAQAVKLQTALAAFGGVLPEPGAEMALRRQLEERRQQFAQQTAARTRLEHERAQLAMRLENLKRDHEELCRQAQLPPPSVELYSTNADPDLTARFQAQWTTLDTVRAGLEPLRAAVVQAEAKAEASRQNLAGLQKAATTQSVELEKQMKGSAFATVANLRSARLDEAEAAQIVALKDELSTRAQALAGQLGHVREQIRGLRERQAPEGEALAGFEARLKTLEEGSANATERRALLGSDLARDEQSRRSLADELAQWEKDSAEVAVWERLRRLIGSADGSVFQQFAQGLSLDLLVRHANRHLARLSDRYRLRRVESGELTLEIVDRHQADAVRPMQSLSGGESFLASLALALGLSDLAGRNVRIDSLFIDEGFGSLDAATLDVAVAALESLRLSHKTVGIISHVDLLKERIPVQIRIEKQAGGVSVLHIPSAA